MIVKTQNDKKFVQKNFVQYKTKLLNKISAAETHFEQLLIAGGIYFVREKCNFRRNTRWSYFDFYLPFYCVYVEIDGSSHDSEEQKEIDRIKESIVTREHKFMVRFTNEQVLAMDRIDIDFILNEQAMQRKKRNKRGGVVRYKNKYLKMMNKKRAQAREDILKSILPEIDQNREIWLYDHYIGNYFRFDNIFDAKFTTEKTTKDIYELCERKDYKKNQVRRFVFAYSLADCERKVAQVYY